LNPGIKKGEWTAEEDEIIMSMQQEWGNQWAKITSLLPGRTDNAVKNRYHATLRAAKGKRFNCINGNRTFTTTASSSSGSTTVDLDMDMEMDMELEDEDVDGDGEETDSQPISQSLSTSNIVDGKIHLSTDLNMLSMKSLNAIYPQATASTIPVMGTLLQPSEVSLFPVGTVIGSSNMVASSPVPSDSIGSIDMMTDWNYSCLNEENQFIPLEIDIDGLRDWGVNQDDDYMEDGSNIDEDSPRRDSSCFARIKQEVRKVSEESMSMGWRIGGLTNTLCGDRFYMQDNQPKPSSTASSSIFCGVSNPFYSSQCR
jgi:hypothetical protein